MLDSSPYLIFKLGDFQYGLKANLVREIFALPELTSVPEAPRDIIGILNLRGKVLPVMHLALRLGQTDVFCQVSNQIVVLDWRGLQIGIVVEQVQELQVIESAMIQSELDFGRVNNINSAFVAGVAKLESQLVVLLNHETLIRQPEQVTALNLEDSIQLNSIEDGSDLALEIFTPTLFKFGSFYDRFCPDITSAQQEIFRQRAEDLRLPLLDLTDSTGLSPLAVVSLGGEYFGIELASIQEFTSIRNLTQIPCCPSHIVGNMNLRGEIVTLVDIRSLLNIPITPVKIGSQTVVVQVDDIIAGLPVDDVSDVMYIDPLDIKPVPIAAHGKNDAFLKGIIPVFDRVLGVLDLPKMMTQGGLAVDDE
jgi:purine-binding chemotaxis protein CheW